MHGQHGQRPAEVVPIRAPHGLRQDEKGPQLQPTRVGRLGLLVEDQAVLGEGVAVVGVQAEVASEILGGLGVVADLFRGRRQVLERGGGAPHLEGVQEMHAAGENDAEGQHGRHALDVDGSGDGG